MFRPFRVFRSDFCFYFIWFNQRYQKNSSEKSNQMLVQITEFQLQLIVLNFVKISQTC